MKSKKPKKISDASKSNQVDVRADILEEYAIKDALKKALMAKPVDIHSEDRIFKGFEIDGEIWTEDSAIEKILSNYSWETV